MRPRWCPSCGQAHEHYTWAAGEGRIGLNPPPETDDVAVCWECGALSFYTEAGLLRAPTGDELDELLAKPEVQDAIGLRWMMRVARGLG